MSEVLRIIGLRRIYGQGKVGISSIQSVGYTKTYGRMIGRLGVGHIGGALSIVDLLSVLITI